MKGYKHNTNRKPPGPLPLFPVPYPGESFYSVLCRYHVRSGNVNDWHTSNQLFGYNSSLTSTLLTPFHLEMVKRWLSPSSGINSEKMLRSNTAFNLYAITSISRELEQIRDVIDGRKATASFPRWMHPRIIHPSGYLRFCPECAAAQRKLYGEPYWQVLPQIEEVEYCPRHKARIRDSHIQLESIGFHYHPASSVLTEGYPGTVGKNRCQRWETLYKKEKPFFIKLAENIDWLLQNGEPYAGYERLCRVYNRLSGKDVYHGWFEIRKQRLWEAFSGISRSNQLYSYLEYKNPRQVGGTSLYLYSVRVCSHVMIMTALFGDPKTFYEH